MPTATVSETSTRTVALIGNPNTGKSSLFNALCGLNARVGNYPGVTVEQKVGSLTGSKLSIDVIDLPGTYSLAARSADEAVAVNVLSGELAHQAAPEIAIVILDASNIERNFYLFSQVYELGLPVIAVLNMWDRVEAEGLTVDAEVIAKRLGVPVVGKQTKRQRRASKHNRTNAPISTNKTYFLPTCPCAVPRSVPARGTKALRVAAFERTQDFTL